MAAGPLTRALMVVGAVPGAHFGAALVIEVLAFITQGNLTREGPPSAIAGP